MHGLRGIQRLPVNRWPREFLPPLYPTNQNDPNNPTEDNRVTKEKEPSQPENDSLYDSKITY